MTSKFYSLGKTLLIVLISTFAQAQNISPLFFGQNAWMPDTIGSRVYYGKFYQKLPEIQESGARIIRFGGIGPDQNKPTNYQYIKMVDKIRSIGMEPALQVPYNKGVYTAAQAAEIVKYVNITKGKNVKYWIIGNEPNLVYGYTTASQIAAYIKTFSSAMKEIDPTIKVIGPECAWYDYPVYNGLTTPGGSSDITGKDSKGRYYVDIISFHTYPFSGSQTRQDVINKLTSASGFQHSLNDLNSKISACNSFHGRTGDYALKGAVTEANVNYKNNASDDLYGNGANSFIGGQFWAEMMAIGMNKGLEFINFWSVIEGNTNELNIGYLDRSNGNKKPTFYHFQMMSENFKGIFIPGTDNQTNVKVFGSKDNSQISVMILNQDQAANYNYTLRLNNAGVSGSSTLKINLNAGADREFTGSINNQSTQVLVFDLSGNLIKTIDYKLNGNADSNLPPTVTNVLVTGQKEFDGKADLRIYPNPSPGELNLDVHNLREGEKLEVELINMLGQQVLTKNFICEGERLQEKITPATDIAQGTYIIRLKIREKYFTRKILISRGDLHKL